MEEQNWQKKTKKGSDSVVLSWTHGKNQEFILQDYPVFIMFFLHDFFDA